MGGEDTRGHHPRAVWSVLHEGLTENVYFLQKVPLGGTAAKAEDTEEIQHKCI